MIPPTIEFVEGDNGVVILDIYVEGYDLKSGVIVNDDSSITLDDVEIIGDLSSIAGKYTLTYKVTDKFGNVTEKDRTITVISVEDGNTFTDTMMSSSAVMNNDPDGNLRYVGLSPNNYVQFNNELWRIIGVFNGQAKIIRNDYYGSEISWDDNVNDWSTASLQGELNGTYFDSIEPISKSYIDQTHVWNLGGLTQTTSTWTRSNLYFLERGSVVSSGRSTTWTGAVGLMYPSDYGYSTNGATTTCDGINMNQWRADRNSTAFTECAEKSWLYDSNYNQWVVTSTSDSSSKVFYILKTGDLWVYALTDLTRSARPVVYLNLNVGIVGGSGSSGDPYILAQ